MTVRIMTAEAIEAINLDQLAWNDLVAKVGEDRMEDRPFIGTWTFKAFAGHLQGWSHRRVRRVEAAVRGEAEPPNPWPAEMDDLADLDEINAWIDEQYRDKSLADVLNGATTGYDRLRAAVSAMPPDQLNDPNLFHWLEGESLGAALVSGSYFSHLPEEHGDDVEAWLATHGARYRANSGAYTFAK
jgi:hypothetical protein